jgi:hypothetical protein
MPASKDRRGARAGLLEDHHQRAVLQRPMTLVGLEAGLDDARALEDVVEFVAREILELQEMPRSVTTVRLRGIL